MNFFKIILLSSFAFLSMQCSAQKKNSSKNKATNTKVSNANIQKIELEEMTRGSRRMITITPNSKVVEINGQPSTKKITNTEWNNLMKLASGVDIKKLNTFEAPTTKRYYDGAMTAMMKITSNGIIYESQGFDAGAPPKAFSDFYNTISADFKVK